MERPLTRWSRWRRRLAWLIALVVCVLVAAGIALDHLDRLSPFSGPLTSELPAPAAPRDGLGVVLLSGDMGFRFGLSGRVGERMAQAGYPVIGINSLMFAADGRTAGEIGALLDTTIARLLAKPGVRRVVLIGHSFGADLLHVGLVHLPKAMRDKVALVILEVPTDSVYLTAGFREYFDLGKPDVVALDSARQLDWVPVTCIHGAEETTSLCPMLAALDLPDFRDVALPGGHTLNHDPAPLFAASFDAIQHHRR